MSAPSAPAGPRYPTGVWRARLDRLRRALARRVPWVVGDPLVALRLQSALWPHERQPDRTAPTPDRLAALRGRAGGRRCFIVGTAPSVDRLDLSRIGDHFVFLVNRGYLLADRLARPPDALVITNPHAFAEYGAEATALPWSHVFLASAVDAGAVRADPRTRVFAQYETPRIDDGLFQFDLTRPLYHANTVVLSAVQIAHGMGFAEICVVGVDLDFSPAEAHFYASSLEERARTAAISRFTADRMLRGFALSSRLVAAAGHSRLVNAGIGGRLDCIPRVPFDTLTADV